MEPFFSAYQPVVAKSKFLTILFSFVPGAGHLYLGQLTRGLMFMMLLVVDIVLLATIQDSHFPFSFGLSVFFGLMIPVVMMVNLFDALQQVDYHNVQIRRMQGPPPQPYAPQPEQSTYSYRL